MEDNPIFNELNKSPMGSTKEYMNYKQNCQTDYARYTYIIHI